MTQHLHGEARERLVADVVARYVAGATIRQVAAAVGYSYQAVRTMLLGAGVTLRPRNVLPPPPSPSAREPLAVACPVCEEPAGSRCRRPNLRVCRPHRARVELAAEREALR